MRKTSRQIRERSLRLIKLTEAQAALGWGIILIMLALIGAIYLGQTSKIAASGRKVQDMQVELNALREENAVLERDIAQVQTLEYLRQESERLGFVSAQPYDVEYLVIPEYPPATAVTAPTALQEPLPEPAENMQEALLLAIEAAFIDLAIGEANEQ
ncbi:MAG: hypothetical protein KDE48_14380 [Anaerolineales bacterium]|nr:hypothetical protein [Anaerolineales bacterium]